MQSKVLGYGLYNVVTGEMFGGYEHLSPTFKDAEHIRDNCFGVGQATQLAIVLVHISVAE